MTNHTANMTMPGRLRCAVAAAVGRALQRTGERPDDNAQPPEDSGQPAPGAAEADGIPVHATYLGVRFEGLFYLASGALRVTVGAPAKTYGSPTGAAKAIVEHCHRGRKAPNPSSGWRFWRLANGDELGTIRAALSS